MFVCLEKNASLRSGWSLGESVPGQTDLPSGTVLLDLLSFQFVFCGHYFAAKIRKNPEIVG
jgi:hypothetical protein